MNLNTSQLYPVLGVYSLLINNAKRFRIRVRSRQMFDIPIGIMIYTGSARGRGSSNLANRIMRHFNPPTAKKHFWHIDFLLAKTGPPALCLYANTTSRMECTIVQTLLTLGGSIIPNFGASDCKAHCGSHLLNFRQFQQALLSLVHTYQIHDLHSHVFIPKVRNMSDTRSFYEKRWSIKKRTH